MSTAKIQELLGSKPQNEVLKDTKKKALKQRKKLEDYNSIIFFVHVSILRNVEYSILLLGICSRGRGEAIPQVSPNFVVVCSRFTA